MKEGLHNSEIVTASLKSVRVRRCNHWENLATATVMPPGPSAEGKFGNVAGRISCRAKPLVWRIDDVCLDIREGAS